MPVKLVSGWSRLKANEGKHDWELPADVAQKTIDKYLEAYEMITGKKLEA